jgi:hypothetical protein
VKLRTLTSNHVGDLDDGVDLGFREHALSTGALDIEGEDS